VHRPGLVPEIATQMPFPLSEEMSLDLGFAVADVKVHADGRGARFAFAGGTWLPNDRRLYNWIRKLSPR